MFHPVHKIFNGSTLMIKNLSIQQGIPSDEMRGKPGEPERKKERVTDSESKRRHAWEMIIFCGGD